MNEIALRSFVVKQQREKSVVLVINETAKYEVSCINCNHITTETWYTTSVNVDQFTYKAVSATTSRVFDQIYHHLVFGF